MSAEFDVVDPSTWPVVLTAEQVAAIYQRPVGGIKHKVHLGTFVPAPFLKYPMRWRKADVERHAIGARPSCGRKTA